MNETCDRCNARARVEANFFINVRKLPPLYLCGHHARKHKDALNGDGWILVLLEGDTEVSEWVSELADIATPS